MKYPFTVNYYNENGHSFWIAESSALKGCAGQGETVDDAVRVLEENEIVWLETAEEFSIPIPEVPVTTVQEHSGKFTVRVSPFVHGQAVDQAKKQGISLNQYINDAIVNYNTVCATVSHISPAMEDCAKALRAKFLESTASNGWEETRYLLRPNSRLSYSFA